MRGDSVRHRPQHGSTLTPAIARAGRGVARRIGTGPRVLFIGRLVPYKGVDVLLRAMARVDATAWVVGDGPLRQALEGEAAGLGLADRVRFLGSLPDAEVVAHLHACDVFVLPSVTHAETFGMVQLEAMTCGKPVVSTNLRSGVPWVNRHEETGLVVEPGDAEGLADALDAPAQRRGPARAAWARPDERACCVTSRSRRWPRAPRRSIARPWRDVRIVCSLEPIPECLTQTSIA